MRQGRKQIGTERSQGVGKVALEGGEEALEAGLLLFQEHVHGPGLAGKKTFNFPLRILRIAVGQKISSSKRSSYIGSSRRSRGSPPNSCPPR